MQKGLRKVVRVSKCWLARTCVGAMRTTIRPCLSVCKAAAAATTVLPEPTSP